MSTKDPIFELTNRLNTLQTQATATQTALTNLTNSLSATTSATPSGTGTNWGIGKTLSVNLLRNTFSGVTRCQLSLPVCTLATGDNSRSVWSAIVPAGFRPLKQTSFVAVVTGGTLAVVTVHGLLETNGDLSLGLETKVSSTSTGYVGDDIALVGDNGKTFTLTDCQFVYLS